MTRRLPSHSCQDWHAVQFQNYPALDLNCPYFPKEANAPILGFPKNIDPWGLLTRAGKAKGLQPSPDSLVEYYERSIDSIRDDRM